MTEILRSAHRYCYVFCVDFTTDSVYFPVVFYNLDEVFTARYELAL